MVHMTPSDDRIEIDPNRCHGQPVIRDTRVPVRTLLGAVAAGDSIEQVAADYGVTVEDVRAAIGFAKQFLDEQSFHPARR
jgi:uncharacterized protein (DUF433 family)